MASPKQLVAFGDKTLLEHAICTAKQASDGPIIVILGAHADRICRSLGITFDPIYSEASKCSILTDGPNRTQFLYNSHWSEGQSSSIAMGVCAALHLNSHAALVMLCDQPYIEPLELQKLIVANTRSSVGISAAAYAHTIGVPACFSRSRFDELLQLRGERGAKTLLTKYLDQIERVAMSSAETDIDTSADLRRLEEWSAISKGFSKETSTYT